MPSFKRITLGFILALFVYLGIFTWNIRTGYIDDLASNTGLEFSRWIIAPGRWVSETVGNFLDRYVYLVGLRQENEELKAELAKTTEENIKNKEEAGEVHRLRALLQMPPVQGWSRNGARVVYMRLGPTSVSETLLIDKGSNQGLKANDPIVSSLGVVGRVLKVSPNASMVLLITDPNSRIPIISQDSRVNGVLAGGGPTHPLRLLYLPLNSEIQEGEILVTSHIGGVFPQGLPVAKVQKVDNNSTLVLARPFFSLNNMEEVLVLQKESEPVVQVEKEEARTQNVSAEKESAKPPAKPAAASRQRAPAVTGPAENSPEVRSPNIRNRSRSQPVANPQTGARPNETAPAAERRAAH